MDMENEEIGEVEQMPSIRRTITRNSAARQVAVNFMPSRQMPHNTLRLRRNNSEHNALLDAAAESTDTPDAADIIVREMEQHQRLMEDSPLAEELRREALRDLPQCLTMKRNVRAKLSASVSLRSKRRPISVFKRLKYRISFAWKRASDRMRDIVFSIELWYEAIRNIEGHFGSAVGSYFYLLRWLFALNMLLATVLLAFVVIPQVLHDNHANSTAVQRKGFMDFISGKGWLEDTLLFYGHYHAGDIETPGPLTYNMPFAYFFTMVCLYLLTFAVLCYRTAYSYRVNFIETSGGLGHVFASKVFCGWDFGVVEPRAAHLNAASLYLEFKELLSEQNKKKITSSWCTRFGQNLVNTLVTLFVVGLVGAIELGLWFLLGWETNLVHWELMVSVVVTLVVTVLPLFFNLVVRLEYYRPRTALYVTLARTWLLDAGTLLLLLVYWSRSSAQCWETIFGQEAYRLVLLDAVISLLVLPAIEFSRAFVHKLNPSAGGPEFNIAYNSLTLLYNQGVVWLGAIFSPPLAAAVAIKFFLLFYVKRLVALKACQPARKVWRAAQTQTVLYMLVTLSLFVALFALGSSFFKMSSSCGAFRHYEFVYQVFSEGVLKLHHHHTLKSVLAFVVRPGVIGFVMLFLCTAVYYMRARALAQRSMVTLLRQMLVLQAKDKDFLLTAITNVANGEWLYSPKPEDEGPDSHTFKYLREVRKPSNSGFHFDPSRLNHSLVEGRPRSYHKEGRPISHHTEKRSEDGDTDSSFSWQGSSNCLSKSDVEGDRRLL